MTFNIKCRECGKHFNYDPENGPEKLCCGCYDKKENERMMNDPEYRKEIEEANDMLEKHFPTPVEDKTSVYPYGSENYRREWGFTHKIDLQTYTVTCDCCKETVYSKFYGMSDPFNLQIMGIFMVESEKAEKAHDDVCKVINAPTNYSNFPEYAPYPEDGDLGGE